MFGLKNSKNEIQLGDRARDKITGFEGVVTSITYWLNGCRRIGIQPENLKDSIPVESHAFDGPQVELISRADEPSEPEYEKTGGPAFKPAVKKNPK